MNSWIRDTLMDHIGHHVVCVYYGDYEDPADVCVECEDCGCVLISAEDFDDEDHDEDEEDKNEYSV